MERVQTIINGARTVLLALLYLLALIGAGDLLRFALGGVR